MFEVIRQRMFFAKVQAELKAQYNDQNFVNRVCQLPPTMRLIAESREHAYFDGTKIAPFLYVLIVLGEAVTSELLPEEDRNLSAALLKDRLSKANSNPGFRIAHISVIHEAEQKLSTWEEKRAHSPVSEGADSDSDDDFIRGTGRYELRYKIELVQKLRGKKITSEEISGVRSDDLDRLKSMVFMHSLAGKEVELRDLTTGEVIAVD
ncbi:MAG: hypothetical protein ABIR13_03865 [Polaromonas sp.]